MSRRQTSPSMETGKLPGRRMTALLADGSYVFEDQLSGTTLNATLITCTAWLLEFYELSSGAVYFVTRAGDVRPPTTRVGVLYPPFSICCLRLEEATGRVIGIAASEELPREFARTPIIFHPVFIVPPDSAKQAIKLLTAGANYQSVDPNPAASLLSLKAKKLLDTNYLNFPSIARVAQRLGVSHAHLSRQFKSDFEMSPSEYLRRLRVADAPLKLARGEEIIDVSHEVGYNDLSRFYKQFRKTTHTSPGVCKTMMRPQS